LSAVGLVGVLIFLAGAHLLWQGRREILFWLGEFFRILRREFTRRKTGVVPPGAFPEGAPAGVPAAPKRDRGTLRLVGGLALVFLGQVLLLLDLVF
jgi:hypothetical protein